MRIRIWRSYGTKVVVATDDITKEESVKNLLETANLLAPVSGIFNLAVVSLILFQTFYTKNVIKNGRGS